MVEGNPPSLKLWRTRPIFARASSGLGRAMAGLLMSGGAGGAGGRSGNLVGEAGNSKTLFFPKRTHRFWRGNSLYHACGKILLGLQGDVCRWVRFGKRTHREGVLALWRGGSLNV